MSVAVVIGMHMTSFSQIVIPDKIMVELDDNYYHAPKIRKLGPNSFVLAWLEDEIVLGNFWNNINFRIFKLNGDTLSGIKKFIVPDSIRGPFGDIVIRTTDSTIHIAASTLLNNSSYLYYQSFDSNGQKIGGPVVSKIPDILIWPVESTTDDLNYAYLTYLRDDSGIYVVRYDTTSLSDNGTVIVKHNPYNLFGYVHATHLHQPDDISIIWPQSWNKYYLTRYSLNGDSLMTGLFMDKSDEDNIIQHLKIKTDTSDNYIVAWIHYLGNGFGNLYVRQYDNEGNPISPEILIFDPEAASYASNYYAFDIGEDRRTATAWMDYRDNKDIYDAVDTIDIYMQLLEKDGTKIGSNFKASSFFGENLQYPDLALIDDNIYLVWQLDGKIYMNVHSWPAEVSSFKNISDSDIPEIEVFPNPSNEDIEFNLYLKSAADVQLIIYDLAGSIVNFIFEGRLSAGKHSIKWNGMNDRGMKVRSGIYLYSIETAAGQKSGKLYYQYR